jgi:hypothetical protein
MVAILCPAGPADAGRTLAVALNRARLVRD